MNQKAKMLILVLIILLATLVVGAYFVKKKTVSIPNSQVTTSPAVKNNTQNVEQPTVTKEPGTTIEGMIISIGEKNIAISNNSPEPALIGISATTTVVNIDKDNVETPAGLSSIIAGNNAKVLYDKNKNAEKIYLISK